MRETGSPPRSPRRVRVYERLSRDGASPVKAITIGVAAFIILILIVIILASMR